MDNSLIKKNISLKPHNTFGVEVKANYFAEYQTVEQLKKILSSWQQTDNSQKILHIGSGSNLLFIKDFEGLILHSKIDKIEILEEDDKQVKLRVGAGVVWDDFVEYCVEKKWVGVENLSLIFGEVGAGAVQNIGAYGVEIKDVIKEVETLEISTLKKKVFSKKECQYDYRKSIFKAEKKGQYIVTHVILQLSKEPNFTLHYSNLKENVQKKGEINLQNIRQTVIEIRESKLPNPEKIGNAGSFFMNPMIDKEKFNKLKSKYESIPSYPIDDERVKIPAGWLIEKAGLKGEKVGNVGVHKKQALVIVNYGNATGLEIKSMADNVQKVVKNKFDILLQPEVNYIGSSFIFLTNIIVFIIISYNNKYNYKN